jgi:molybdate transport system ATP-binding protein
MMLEVAASLTAGTFRLDVAFTAPPGITALFGPSGAGKTLTLRCIAGLTRPDRGRIALDDHLLFDSDLAIDLPARSRRVGYLFQQYALFPHLDVAGNIRLALRGTRSQRTARTTELLEMVGLPGFESRSIRQLSGGEQQRVALARALAPDPEVLLLDEPLSALDGRTRRRLRAELRRIHSITGIPMVLVTHSLREMRELSDWLVLYDAGRTLGTGPTADLLREPGSPEAAELLADADG